MPQDSRCVEDCGVVASYAPVPQVTQILLPYAVARIDRFRNDNRKDILHGSDNEQQARNSLIIRVHNVRLSECAYKICLEAI